MIGNVYERSGWTITNVHQGNVPASATETQLEIDKKNDRAKNVDVNVTHQKLLISQRKIWI